MNLIRHMLAQLLRVGKIRPFLMQIIREWDISLADDMIYLGSISPFSSLYICTFLHECDIMINLREQRDSFNKMLCTCLLGIMIMV